MSDKPKTKTVWIAWTNSDLTEGRGYNFPLAISESRACAIRCGKKGNVQGRDCPVEAYEAIYHNGYWCIPGRFENSTKEDDAADKRHEAFKAALDKAKAAGMDDETINALRNA